MHILRLFSARREFKVFAFLLGHYLRARSVIDGTMFFLYRSKQDMVAMVVCAVLRVRAHPFLPLPPTYTHTSSLHSRPQSPRSF